MGVVYAAHDPRLDRQVAVKILPPDLTRDETAKQRFLREAKTASALDHPNICTIHEVNETPDGQLYLVMAHYEGETLKQRIERGPLALDDAVEIATQVGRGLAKAHGADIVHRDIKPANIILTRDGTVKILDFGIAKLTSAETMTDTGVTLGTVAYMAPEQLRGEVADARTDIWSLGIVLYEMLTGRRPFDGESAEGTAMAILATDVPPLRDYCPAAPTSVVEAVSACLEKSREVRCQSAGDLLERFGGSARASSTPTAPTLTVVSVERPSIAVLPFANLSADPEQEFFCEGLAEDVLDALSRLDDLRVASRSSAFRFRERDQDLREVGRKLAVTAVLEGSVRRVGNRLRINTRLVNVGDGSQTWSDRYDRQLDDIFEVQDEIASAVVQALQVKLLRAEERPLVSRPTDNLDAYTCYMRGRYYRTSRYDVARGRQEFEEAVRLDPGFASAWIGIADSAVMSAYLGVQPPHALNQEARAAIERALALDDTLAEAHSTQAKMRFVFDWQWDEGERGYLRAIELDPRNADLRAAHATLLSFLYRSEEALAEVAKARELDPTSGYAAMTASSAYLLSRRFDEAADAAREALELQPDHPNALIDLSVSCWGRGLYDDAVACCRRIPAAVAAQTYFLGHLGFMLGQAGQRDEALQLLDELQERRRTGHVGSYWFAVLRAGVGELEQALDYLERAYDERAPEMLYLQWNQWDVARDQPRYQDLHRRVGLPTAPWA